jgi:hypothetical protein
MPPVRIDMTNGNNCHLSISVTIPRSEAGTQASIILARPGQSSAEPAPMRVDFSVEDVMGERFKNVITAAPPEPLTPVDTLFPSHEPANHGPGLI